MPELAIDKTKRNIIQAMNKYKPVYTVTLVIEDISDINKANSKILAKNLPLIKDRVSRINKDSVIIWWLRGKLIQKGHIIAPMVCMYFTKKPDMKKLNIEIADILHPLGIRLLNRKFSDLRLSSWCNAVKTQKLHDLTKSFNETGLRRFAIRNKTALAE